VALPWKTLASVETPDGALDLRVRGAKDFLITIRGRVLMSSAAHRSEEALAKLACAHLKTRVGARVLISGLGMGYTLRAALGELAPDARVVVAELNAIVADWCAGPLGALTAHAVNDSRVTLMIQDVAKLIAEQGLARNAKDPRFDAIVLDMYQGPQSRVHANDPLYGVYAAARVRSALSLDGVFAVWCEGPSQGFEASLNSAGFRFKLERAGKGARIHYMYIATPSQ
jgi:spermidine synthase